VCRLAARRAVALAADVSILQLSSSQHRRPSGGLQSIFYTLVTSELVELIDIACVTQVSTDEVANLSISIKI
jgi:hypothetical protein